MKPAAFCPIARGACVLCSSAALAPRFRFTSRSFLTSHIASCNQLRQHAEFPEVKPSVRLSFFDLTLAFRLSG